jgi:hypothetical protein
MTLSKNEQIMVYVVFFLVIAVAGLFVIILPARDNIAVNRGVLEQRQGVLDDYERRLGDDAFTQIGIDIMAAYRDGVGASEFFYEDEMSSYEADRLIRGILAEISNPANETGTLQFLPDNLRVNALSTHSLAANVFLPFDISYNIKELARIGTADDYASGDSEEGGGGESTEGEGSEEGGGADPGLVAESGMPLSDMRRFMTAASRGQALNFYNDNKDDSAMIANLITTMRLFLARETETVLAQTVSFEIPLTEEEAFAISMHVFELPNATYIRIMTRDEDEVSGGGAAPPVADGGDEEAPAPTPTPGGSRMLYTIEVVFLIVEPMQEPNSDDFTFLTFQ